LLVAIAAILGGIGVTYRAQKKAIRQQAPPKPAALPTELNSTAEHWHYGRTDEKSQRKVIDIDAADYRQVADSSRVDLRDVTLRIYNQTGDAYNLVKSAAATFFVNEHRLYSDGATQITLSVPIQGQSAHRPVSIESSAVNFDTDTYRAETDRPTTFVFERGDGKANGASYDPGVHELQLKSDVLVHWKSAAPDAKPMTIEAGALTYHEATSEIWLKPWGRMTREKTVIEGNDVVVHLRDQQVEKIEATHARGNAEYPTRKLQYGADFLLVDFVGNALIQKITGEGNAKLVSTSDSAETTTTGNHVEMYFDAQGKESLLTRVSAAGNGVVTAKPLPVAGRQISETHVLRADQLEMKMRPGGRELESVVTHTPGSLEFLPNLPVQHHRLLDGKNMVIAYGPQNRIDNFRATDVKTQTDPTADEKKHNRSRSITTSREMVAQFEPKSSRMASMEQSGNFTYDEGDRRARSAKATMDSNQNVILLDTAARFWDSTGSTSADHIRMDQRTGDFTAEGRVTSSRMPDPDPKKNSQMLSGDQPLQAQARKMVSTNHNRAIRYEGNVMMWQGANRIQADVVDIDREKRTLVAGGSVVTSLWQEPKDDDKKKTGPPVLTVVHAPRLVYTDENRLAVYTGGVTLVRPGLQEKSRELRAFLSPSGSDNSLDKAFADGGVVIVQNSPGRTRTGTAEHSEYYTDEQKIVLRQGQPRMVDSCKGTTVGSELTYFANDDSLLVNGALSQPVESRINRKAKCK
jgi:lipopolysaccharide export system protein LptA